jgi:hypothetical protein
MRLLYALSQLAVLGATSIELANGRKSALEHADSLLDDRSTLFELRARETSVDVIDTRGRLFARARTLWAVGRELKTAVG